MELDSLKDSKESAKVPDLTQTATSGYIYLSHFLKTFGDRLWSFALPILFMEIWTETLLPAAIFMFSLYFTSLLLMNFVGEWIDRSNRMLVVRIGKITQNIFIVLSCGCMAIIVVWVEPGGVPHPDWTPELIAAFSAVLLTATVASLMGNATGLSLERDWVVVIAGDDRQYLTSMNVALRRIDLMCKLFAPMIFGFVMQLVPLEGKELVLTGLGVVAGWNIAVLGPEYYALVRIYHAYPLLAVKTGGKKRDNPLKVLWQGWGTYIRHRVFLGSVAYAMLYLTVLDNGVLMTAYLKWAGVPEGLLGASRGVGAIFGLAGTVAFPYFLRCFGGSLPTTGVFTIWMFFLTIAPAAVVFLLTEEFAVDLSIDGEDMRAYALLGAVAVARFFLWAFDLDLTQIIQEGVEEEKRGIVNAVQTATYQIFWVILSVLGMIFSDPDDFAILTYISVGAVALSCVLFSLWTVCFSSPRRDYTQLDDDDESTCAGSEM